MSRIGNKLITIPTGVTVDVAAGNEVTVKGPKGTLTRTFSPLMDIQVENNEVTVKRPMMKNILSNCTERLEHCFIIWLSAYPMASLRNWNL